MTEQQLLKIGIIKAYALRAHTYMFQKYYLGSFKVFQRCFQCPTRQLSCKITLSEFHQKFLIGSILGPISAISLIAIFAIFVFRPRDFDWIIGCILHDDVMCESKLRGFSKNHEAHESSKVRIYYFTS